MRTIWKYELEITDFQTLQIPGGAELLCVQVQFGKPCLWALVEPHFDKTPRTIAIRGTGHPFEIPMPVYVDTFQMNGGMLVFHAFESLPTN